MSKKEKYEDISSSSKPSGFKESVRYFLEKIKIFFVRNHRRNLKAIIGIVICLCLIVLAMGSAYLRKLLNLIKYEPGNTGNPDATFVDDYEVDENLSFASISDVGASSIKEYAKSWATNGGDQLYSKNVINVLLIGADGNEDETFLRSDTMMIASINTKTKKITLCSVMRDSYSYMNINGEDRYDKINAAYAWGGASKLMEVLSNDFKIKIDHYVSVNFKSFAKVINLLGGIDVPITEAEADFMNRTTQPKGFTAGESVHLNGERALIYARIRKLDSDIERTRRQRNVISAAIKKVKASSISDINNLIETFLPYITTNYRTSEIVSLGTQALSGGWQNYEIEGIVEPGEDSRTAVNNFGTNSGYVFVWIVDYTLAAREVQLAMYGNTNIELGDDHISPVDMANGTAPTSSYYGGTTRGYYSYRYGTTNNYDSTNRWTSPWTRSGTNIYGESTTGLREKWSSRLDRTTQANNGGNGGETSRFFSSEADVESTTEFVEPITEPQEVTDLPTVPEPTVPPETQTVTEAPETYEAA